MSIGLSEYDFSAHRGFIREIRALSVNHTAEMQPGKQNNQLKEAKSCRDLQYWVFLSEFSTTSKPFTLYWT